MSAISATTFLNWPTATLQTAFTNGTTAFSELMENKISSYSMLGRNFTYHNISEFAALIGAMGEALELRNSTTQRWGFANVNESMFGGA